MWDSADRYSYMLGYRRTPCSCHPDMWDESSPSRGFLQKGGHAIRMDGIECCGKAEARVCPKRKK